METQVNGENDLNLIELVVDIVSAFVSNNRTQITELPDLISAVHSSLENIGKPKVETLPAPAPVPAISVKKSITDDYLVCLEDGKKFKSLRRHLQTAFGMTPDDYRAKWNLPRDYPMVAPGYAAKRSELAKATGLGSSRRTAKSAAAAAPANDTAMAAPEMAEAPARRRGRPKKAA